MASIQGSLNQLVGTVAGGVAGLTHYMGKANKKPNINAPTAGSSLEPSDIRMIKRELALDKAREEIRATTLQNEERKKLRELILNPNLRGDIHG